MVHTLPQRQPSCGGHFENFPHICITHGLYVTQTWLPLDAFVQIIINYNKEVFSVYTELPWMPSLQQGVSGGRHIQLGRCVESKPSKKLLHLSPSLAWLQHCQLQSWHSLTMVSHFVWLSHCPETSSWIVVRHGLQQIMASCFTMNVVIKILLSLGSQILSNITVTLLRLGSKQYHS